MTIEFIKHQGEILGERELAARITALEYSPFRRYGRLARSIRLFGRHRWSCDVSWKSPYLTVAAKTIKFG